MKKEILIGIFIVITLIFGCKSDNTQTSNTNPNFKISKMEFVGSELKLVEVNGEQQNPQIIYLPDKKLYFLTWEDWRSGDSDIYGKFLNDDGSPCGDEFKINTDSNQNQTSPSVAYRQADSKILVVW